MWSGINISPDKVDSTVNYPPSEECEATLVFYRTCALVLKTYTNFFLVDISSDQFDKEECGLEME
jgi:hypothetical protein